MLDVRDEVVAGGSTAVTVAGAGAGAGVVGAGARVAGAGAGATGDGDLPSSRSAGAGGELDNWRDLSPGDLSPVFAIGELDDRRVFSSLFTSADLLAEFALVGIGAAGVPGCDTASDELRVLPGGAPGGGAGFTGDAFTGTAAAAAAATAAAPGVPVETDGE